VFGICCSPHACSTHISSDSSSSMGHSLECKHYTIGKGLWRVLTSGCFRGSGCWTRRDAAQHSRCRITVSDSLKPLSLAGRDTLFWTAHSRERERVAVESSYILLKDLTDTWVRSCGSLQSQNQHIFKKNSRRFPAVMFLITDQKPDRLWTWHHHPVTLIIHGQDSMLW
jgi:hypothetical protein